MLSACVCVCLQVCLLAASVEVGHDVEALDLLSQTELLGLSGDDAAKQQAFETDERAKEKRNGARP